MEANKITFHEVYSKIDSIEDKLIDMKVGIAKALGFESLMNQKLELYT